MTTCSEQPSVTTVRVGGAPVPSISVGTQGFSFIYNVKNVSYITFRLGLLPKRKLQDWGKYVRIVFEHFLKDQLNLVLGLLLRNDFFFRSLLQVNDCYVHFSTLYMYMYTEIQVLAARSSTTDSILVVSFALIFFLHQCPCHHILHIILF